MIVTLQCTYLDRYLWQVQGNAGLMYPQTDAGPVPPVPSEPVYVDIIYPPRSDILARQLWVQVSNVLPMLEGFEPIAPEPSEAVYVTVPVTPIPDLPGTMNLPTTWDGYTVAGRLWMGGILVPVVTCRFVQLI